MHFLFLEIIYILSAVHESEMNIVASQILQKASPSFTRAHVMSESRVKQLWSFQRAADIAFWKPNTAH